MESGINNKPERDEIWMVKKGFAQQLLLFATFLILWVLEKIGVM